MKDTGNVGHSLCFAVLSGRGVHLEIGSAGSWSPQNSPRGMGVGSGGRSFPAGLVQGRKMGHWGEGAPR